MSRRRCFMRCERKLPLFGLPKEEEFHDVGCQTDAPQTMSVGTRVLILPKKVTVGTQLAWGTLKHRHVRSKGSQTTESSLRVGNETFSSHPDFHLPSTSIETPGLRPRKRPRLELEYDMEEEEEEEEEDVWDPTREVKNYVDDLMRLVFDEVLEDPTPFVEELKTIPIPGSAPRSRRGLRTVKRFHTTSPAK
ncbi:hypothetical protein F7725_019223 [Dissostichus mawsoni]|uniref:Uncharacterized protein n=1 Tax=Dissostichus mawsoni TaxID=36200 RepID=A0A7J5YJ43_DISMA|nr:hypothetical protein F7725_019223 [Dissostichus mawsoni]